jgi:ribosome-associated protein
VTREENLLEDTPTTTLAKAAADALADKKGVDIVLLDVGDLLTITDVFVIATGTSRPHVQALSEHVVERLKDAGRRPLRDEGLEQAEWVLLDYGDFVVHVFQDEQRHYYGLERLWGDAPRVEWEPVVSDA